MTGYQVVNHHWNRLSLFVLIIFGICACSQTSLPTTEVVVQPAVPTPTLEPTFTPSPVPSRNPQSLPTPTQTDPTPTTAPAQASLSGRILDQDTGQPVAEAQVSAGTASATTDADGRYTLIGLPPGQYVLSVTHPDYDPGLSSILTVAAGEESVVDVPLYAPDASPYPEDPMLTNPLDPNGAPTEEDAERLAREQGLTGEVVSIRETKLSGEFLVNYKLDDEVRAAVALVRHEVWELIDDAGRKWWIIKVCGNLASLLPGQVLIPTPAPKPLPPMAEVLVDGLVVRACAAETCGGVGTVAIGSRIEVFGCLADGGWCQVGWAGGRGWCTGGSLRQLAVAEGVPVVPAVLPTAPPSIPTPIVPTPMQPAQIACSVDAPDIPLGQCTHVRWTIHNVEAAFLNGEGVTGPQGAKRICPQHSTTYVLSVRLIGGGTQTCSRTVNVYGWGGPSYEYY